MNEASYGLLVSFPDESDSFVHGFEAGQLWSVLDRGDVNPDGHLCHAQNFEVIRRMARHFGYTVEFREDANCWATAVFTRGRRPTLTVVPDAAP